MRFYPKARQQRQSIHHPSIRQPRSALLKAAAINLILLQVLFLGLLAYIFGSLSRQNTHVHNINVVFVDYDGDLIGTSVRTAYKQLKGPSFPSLIEQSASQYPQPDTLVSAVCNIDYWGALYTAPDASVRLAAALTGGSSASFYNRSDVLTFVWNEARYPTVADTALADSLASLSAAARIAYSMINGTWATHTLNATDPATVAAFIDPWNLVSINIQPTFQGERLVFNTLMMILILLQEFFYLGIVNSVFVQFQFYVRVAPHHIAIMRQLISATYTLAGSLCTTGAIWGFRDGWNVNSSQFVLTWICLWLFAHLNFLILDVFTVWIPPPFVPMALVSWIVLNVTSILLPFELSPAFYQWAYALPAHSIFQVLVDIWSGGCNPQLNYALPVLFVYELSGLTLSSIGVYRRAHYAIIAQEKGEKVFQERLATALGQKQGETVERRKTEQVMEGTGAAKSEEDEGSIQSAGPMQQRGSIATLADQEELMN
jgi:hypothetical protein